MKFENKVVIVTGAGKGIGRGIALEFAKEGAKIVVADIDEQSGLETVHTINDHGGKAIFIHTDVSTEDSIMHLMRQTVDEYGSIDILINNAGISMWKSPYELEIGEWDRILNTNLRSVFLCSREAAKIMKKSGSGAIVNIASTRAHMSEPNSEAYAASKGGMIALTHALAISLGPNHIRVNVISPGWIETGDNKALREKDHHQHPSMRVGRPEDIARSCLYLCEEGNDFITGSEIIIDGGMTRKMIYEP